MKKIITLVISLFLIVSCSAGTKVENNNTKKIEDKNIENITSGVIENPKELDNFSFLEKKLKSLKDLDISENDLDLFNGLINNILLRNITNIAVKENDLGKCEELSDNYLAECKESVIIKNYNSESKDNGCEQLSNTGAVLNCNNNLYKSLSIKNMDETFCNKIKDDSKENFIINSCKTEVFIKKATKELDYNICNKIDNKDAINMCKILVKGEIDIQ